jgi:multidrug efflux pump subunit AcrA (membrane-fusion protein)
MFAKVKLITEVNEDVPVILTESVVGKKPDTYVYVIEGNRAVFKKVTLGSRQGPYYEVVDGLKEGDLVVIMGQQKLRDGSLVAAEE